MRGIFFAAIFVAFFSVDVFAIAVTIDGKHVEFPDKPPIFSDERVLVPVRAVFEELGFDVMWGEFTQTVLLSRADDTVFLVIGDSEFVANGRIYASEVAAQVIDGRTMLPVRAVLESVGYTVAWHDFSHTVQISAGGRPYAREIPHRRLYDDEIAEWVINYHARGGINDFESEVMRLTNIERENVGLPPLIWCDRLMLSARFKAQSMHNLGYFSHTSPVYGAFQNISFEVFDIPVQSIGENLASGHRTPEDVVAGWMDSDGHRNNILNERYARIGVGFFENFWAQKFLGYSERR
ncbi:MAG: stalk domain-containing protein [Defluviitaleaceae bacterium]|nr:stalk domain-containing protein [Defluviitaleaceae bacterium]